MRWDKKPIDSDAVREFASRYGVDLLPAAIFIRRGITDPQQVRYYLEDDLSTLHNPFLLDEMSDAVTRILDAVAEGERVYVFGDRDVDGITSTVLMTEALRDIGLDTEWGVPMGDNSYGLSTDIVDQCLARDITLLVAVDCGTSNVDEIEYAVQNGIDVIVIDHHNPQERLPPAAAIINPKLSDTAYPFDGLCACALVSKVRLALRFAQTDFFNQPICLLDARPGNECIVLDAVKMENLVPVDSISENLIPGILNVEGSRLADFLVGHEILVYDATGQGKLLQEAFGPDVDVGLVDVAPELWGAFPSLRGKSLLRLREESRLSRYTDSAPSEIDLFRDLFSAFVYQREKSVYQDLEACVDLVALGTLADMMPVQDENRVLVARGLRRMTNNPRPGLHALLQRKRLLGKSIEAKDVGWSISPLINAAGRMGEPDKAVQLLLTEDSAERDRLADYVVQLNERRRQVGEEAWQAVQEQAKASYEAHDGRFILVHGDTIHRGITGIVAGRLARLYGAPAAVVCILAEKAIGSVRTARGMVATDLLARCDDLLSDWGGHDAAGGFNLPADRLGRLEQRLLEVVPVIEMKEREEEIIAVDAELPSGFLSPALMDVVTLFGPYGQDNPPLVFLSRDLRVDDISIMGKEQNHRKLLLNSGTHRWPAVYWNVAEKAGSEPRKGDTVEAVFHLGVNYFNGSETLRLTLVDVRQSLPDSSP
jgi:single-stranded-DNA-specific exonuclease